MNLFAIAVVAIVALPDLCSPSTAAPIAAPFAEGRLAESPATPSPGTHALAPFVFVRPRHVKMITVVGKLDSINLGYHSGVIEIQADKSIMLVELATPLKVNGQVSRCQIDKPKIYIEDPSHPGSVDASCPDRRLGAIPGARVRVDYWLMERPGVPGLIAATDAISVSP